MLNADHEEELRRTIHLLGVTVGMPKVLLHGCSGREIKAVHRKTNDLIQECLKANALGECIHVTGEMRALTDPFHRYLCEEINHSDQRVFRVIFNLPEEYTENTTKILEWNLEGWARDNSERKWYEELRTIYSIANRSVSLYAFDTSHEVQYSVFGNRYTLLQEKHACRTSNKHTWLVESEDMNSLLAVRANALIKKAKDIDEGNYRRFTQNINGIASRRFLSLLSAAHILPIERLITDSIASDFTESTQEILDGLMLMGFIEIHKRESVAITNAGREFANAR
jgi:hypothetical protein